MAEQSLEIKDFSGGMTDNHVGAAINKFQLGQNLKILPGSPALLESRPGGVILDATYNQLPYVTSAKRGDSSFRFKDLNIYQTQNKLYHIKTGVGFTEITGPSSNSAFTTSTVQYDQCSYTEWNNHLLVTSERRARPKFIFKDGSDLKLRNIGLPAVDTSGIGFTAGATASREYGFCYAYTYTIDSVEFTMRGPVSYKAYTGAITNSITGLPVITNGSTDSYDTTVIKLEIYRTADAGDTHYKVGEVTNGTTTYSDTTADGSLDTTLLLYTDADELNYDQPPECKFVVQQNGIAYYLNIKDSLSDIYPNRIVQAAPDQIYAANEGNITDVDGDITGGGVAGQNVVVFTADRTYRLEGFYDSTGRGGTLKVEVSRTVGCISHKSIVQTQEGIFFAAKDGFYFTDGYRVLRISEEIGTTYASSVGNETIRKLIYGSHDPINKLVFWTGCVDTESTDCDMVYVAHLYAGVRPDTPFTTWNGGHWSSNFAPTSLLFYNDQLVTTDKRGYLLQYADGQLNDVKIDTAVAVASWTYYPVIYDLRTAAFDFGDVTRRKWVTNVVLTSEAIAKASISLYSNNDNSGAFQELAEIRSNGVVAWGDTPFPTWGDTSVRWNYLPIITGKRRMPARNLRCSYKQVKVTNAYTVVDSTTTSGYVSVDGSANTVTLLAATYTWDPAAVDYYVSFLDDNYLTEYKVTAVTSSAVLTVEDTFNTLPTTASTSFKLRGYRKSEAIKLLSLSLTFQPISSTQTPYRAAT